MDDILDRYEALTAAFNVPEQKDAELDRLAEEADRLSAAAGGSWLRVMAAALAAAARARSGAETELEVIVDAALPAVDEDAPAQLEELLPGAGRLAERLAGHDEATTVPLEALPEAAAAVLGLLRDRAREDLGLGDEPPLGMATIDEPGTPWLARLAPEATPARLLINASVRWTAAGLVRAIAANAYPGRHLARALRPEAPSWSPSPETTIDRGLAVVGREVLLADHELAHELERIGRRVGARWSGELIVAVARARDGLAPAAARASFGLRSDPLAVAGLIARAAGPPLVREWLAVTGQTAGLGRLLTERLVPTILRAEVADAAG